MGEEPELGFRGCQARPYLSPNVFLTSAKPTPHYLFDFYWPDIRYCRARQFALERTKSLLFSGRNSIQNVQF